jgi:hypothetical protein
MNEHQEAQAGLVLSPYCTNLRSKRLFFSPGPPMIESDVIDACEHCWCRHTMQVLGPDRRRASPDGCRAGRSCFESILGAENQTLS